ncbi:MAG: efflux RND transporter periplasmic adaptor subunit, partial [Halarsenatibacteraceae bacterium]
MIGTLAESRSLQETNSFNAVMQAGSEYAVMPKLEGELEAVNVQVGDRVEQGHVLARIDAERYGYELEQARLQLEMAEKEYRQAELAFAEADDNYQRMANLYDDGAISEQQYNEVKTGRDQAETQLEMAEDGLKQAELAVEGAEKMRNMTVDLYDFRVEEERMVSQANTQYEAAMAALEGAEAMLAETERGPTEEDLKAARAQVEQARVGLKMARSVYEDVEITAPASGFVAQVQMDAGEMAAPGNPLFYIVNLDEIKATANVSSQYVGLLKTGETAGVTVNGLPEGEFTGRISSVAPMAGEQGGFPVEVSVANPEYRIRAGMRGSIEFVIDQVSDAVVIPGDG